MWTTVPRAPSGQIAMDTRLLRTTRRHYYRFEFAISHRCAYPARTLHYRPAAATAAGYIDVDPSRPTTLSD